MAFRYLRDPLFLACCGLYFGQRWLEQHERSSPLLVAYLNDLICVPFWLPILVWVLRKLGWRDHDGPPQALEVAIPLVLWAMVFEVLLPSLPLFAGKAVPNPNDVLCYAAGGAGSLWYWQWRYGRERIQASRTPAQHQPA